MGNPKKQSRFVCLKCMKIGKYLISNSVLLLMFLPLAAITMNKNKVGGNTCYKMDRAFPLKTQFTGGSDYGLQQRRRTGVREVTEMW